MSRLMIYHMSEKLYIKPNAHIFANICPRCCGIILASINIAFSIGPILTARNPFPIFDIEPETVTSRVVFLVVRDTSEGEAHQHTNACPKNCRV